MLRALLRAGAAVGAVALAIGLTAAPAFAHEVRTVGAYQFTVGWQHEPTYVDAQNAVQVFVHDATGNPIDDLGAPPTLKVQVIFGNQTSQFLNLTPSFDPDTGLGTHGEFDAPITPTAAGNYTFHFTGTVKGQVIDQRFTSSDSTFDPVQDPTGIEFPSKDPTAHELGQSIQALSPRIDTAVSKAKSARSTASTGEIIGIVAAALAVIAVGLSLARRRSPGAP
jgi:hypothetical protein